MTKYFSIKTLLCFQLAMIHCLGWTAPCDLQLARRVTYRNAEYSVLENRTVKFSELSNDPAALGIGIYYHHVILNYKGYTISSDGVPGESVYTTLRKRDAFKGMIVAILENLDPETEAKLDQLVSEFVSRTGRSCVALSCDYLTDSGVNDLGRRRWLPTGMIDAILAAKANDPENVKLFTLRGLTMDGAYASSLGITALGGLYWAARLPFRALKAALGYPSL